MGSGTVTHSIVDGTVVIECPGPISTEHHDQLAAQVQAAFPDRRVVVLCDGIKLSIAQQGALARIEAKLDALITALAEDEHSDVDHDLEGNPLPGERDQNQSL